MIRALDKCRYAIRGTTFGTLINTGKSTCQVKPVEIVLKRNASIHTRHILIQKLRLEHINNYGVLLLVSALDLSHQLQKWLHLDQSSDSVFEMFHNFISMYFFPQLFPAATFGLGVWQIKRKVWKEQLIAELKRQMAKEPIDLPEKYDAINK